MPLELSENNNPLYLRVYNYYRELIENGTLAPGTKVQSIRRCSQELQVSRTTAESAYQLLAADGYILSKPQSGFFVTELGAAKRRTVSQPVKKQEQAAVKYDFGAANADQESFDFGLWRRYIKSALRQDERLLSYGEVQGERELREAVCQYIAEKRRTVCRPEQIVIGAGSQNLLQILCPLIRGERTIYMNQDDFRQGYAVFQDFGYRFTEEVNEAEVIWLRSAQMDAGEKKPAGMSVAEQLQIAEWAVENDLLLIEDDYDGEFQFQQHPLPAIQGLAGGKNVVYVGTFSKLLLPSIRISFMILPEKLLSRYRERQHLYNQTASKMEQIALCQFIRDGHLARRLRKTKKIYQEKAKNLRACVREEFGELAVLHHGEMVFQTIIEIRIDTDAKKLQKKLLSRGIRVRTLEQKKGEYPRILLSSTGVPAEQFPDAVGELKKIIYE